LISYWDMLPYELKEYIISLASFQHMRDQRDENYANVVQELNSYFTLRESWGLGHVRISYEKCRFHKGLFWSPRVCKSHVALRMPYTSNESYCHRRFYGTYIDRKT